jgi:hypothetical protein
VGLELRGALLQWVERWSRCGIGWVIEIDDGFWWPFDFDRTVERVFPGFMGWYIRSSVPLRRAGSSTSFLLSARPRIL